MKKKHIILLGNPYSTNSLYRHARGISYVTKKGKDLKLSYIEQAKSQYKSKPLSTFLNLEIHLYFGDERIRDWDNYHKISMDSLTGIVWDDDSQIMRATVEKHKDKQKPRIEIYITDYKTR